MLNQHPTREITATRVPRVDAQNQDLLLGARLLYGVLYGYVYGSGMAVPNHSVLSRDLGVSPRTVRTLIADLEQAGLLRVKRVGARKPNTYQLKFMA